MATPLLEALKPKPFRGDVIAAGVVVLTTLAWLLRTRMDDEWADGVHLFVGVVALLVVAALAVLAPMERQTPRAYQSVLYVATIALALLVFIDLGQTLGGEGGVGEVTWVAAALAAIAFGFASARNSAICTLLGALAVGAAVIAFVAWAFDDNSATTDRWLLLGLMVVFAVGALAQRDRRRAHAVALVDAAGVAVVLIAISLVMSAVLGVAFTEGDVENETINVPWGWELVTVGAAFALIAYSSVDRERGPAYLGVLCAGLFVLMASAGGFAGWPLLLLAIAVVLLVVGLRPTTPAPPSPDADMPPAPAEPLRPG